MLQALEDGSGSLVIPALVPSNERGKWKKEKTFSCPDCRTPVILKTGTKITPHFAHRSTGSCSERDGGEGEYHARGKLQLYQWLRKQRINVQMEFYLPEIQQRPDLFLTIRSKKIALEYQCAAIAPASFRKRTISYLKAGITPVWIAGGNRQHRAGFNSLSLTANDKLFLHQYHSGFSPHLYYYCSRTSKFCFFSNIYFTGHRKNYGNLHYADLCALSFLDLFQFVEENLLIKKGWLEEKKKVRLSIPSVYQREMQRWFRRVYRYGHHPATLPGIIGLPVKSQYRLKIPPAIWQSEIFFHHLLYPPVGSIIFLSRCRHLLSASFISSDFFPLIHGFSCPIEEYFQLLIQCGILKKKETGVYVKLKEITFPPDVESGLIADQMLYEQLVTGKELSF